jgi:hypothetical protein
LPQCGQGLVVLIGALCGEVCSSRLSTSCQRKSGSGVTRPCVSTDSRHHQRARRGAHSALGPPRRSPATGLPRASTPQAGPHWFVVTSPGSSLWRGPRRYPDTLLPTAALRLASAAAEHYRRRRYRHRWPPLHFGRGITPPARNRSVNSVTSRGGDGSGARLQFPDQTPTWRASGSRAVRS